MSTAPSGMTQDQLLANLQRLQVGPASGPPGQPPQGGPPNMNMGTGLPNLPPQQPQGPQQPPPGFFQSPGGQNVPQVGRVQPQWAGTPQIQGGRMGTGGAGGTKVTASGALGLLMGLGFGVHDLLNQKKTTASRSLADQYMDIASTRGPDAAKQWVAEDNKRVRWLNTVSDPKKAGSPEYQGVQQAYQTRLSGEQQQQQQQQQMEQAKIAAMNALAAQRQANAAYEASRPRTEQEKLAEQQRKDQQASDDRRYAVDQRTQNLQSQIAARRQDLQTKIQDLDQRAALARQTQLQLKGMGIKATDRRFSQQMGIFKATTEMSKRYSDVQKSIDDVDRTIKDLTDQRGKLSTWQDWTTSKGDKLTEALAKAETQRDSLTRTLDGINTDYNNMIKGMQGIFTPGMPGGLPGGSPGGGLGATSPAAGQVSAPQYRRNPTTKKVEQSTDGGRTWQ